MPEIRYRMQVISPLFSVGAYQEHPEIRAQSVRGQLRYWYRAMKGAQITDSKQLFAAESAIFGATGAGSPVAVRIVPGECEQGEVRVLPHSTSKRFTKPATKPEGVFDIVLQVRPGGAIPDDFDRALTLWLMLGGIGNRSRRMMGAVQPAFRKDGIGHEEPDWWHVWHVEKDVRVAIGTVLDYAFHMPLSTNVASPNFPTLHPHHSRIMVGTETFGDAQEANIALFRVIRKDSYRSSERIFGMASQGRHASALHAQVRKVGEKYYPIITAMWSSTVSQRSSDRDLFQKALGDLQQEFKAQTVWGEL
jgi:CRISPR type III-B/RAMP module RAMP protein Cmr1